MLFGQLYREHETDALLRSALHRRQDALARIAVEAFDEAERIACAARGVDTETLTQLLGPPDPVDRRLPQPDPGARLDRNQGCRPQFVIGREKVIDGELFGAELEHRAMRITTFDGQPAGKTPIAAIGTAEPVAELGTVAARSIEPPELDEETGEIGDRHPRRPEFDIVNGILLAMPGQAQPSRIPMHDSAHQIPVRYGQIVDSRLVSGRTQSITHSDCAAPPHRGWSTLSDSDHLRLGLDGPNGLPSRSLPGTDHRIGEAKRRPLPIGRAESAASGGLAPRAEAGNPLYRSKRKKLE